MGGERGSEKPRGASGALSPAERRQQRQRERREKKAREKNAAAGALHRAVSKRPASSGSARVSSVKRTRKESSSGSDDNENDGTGKTIAYNKDVAEKLGSPHRIFAQIIGEMKEKQLFPQAQLHGHDLVTQTSFESAAQDSTQ